jgi:flagellar assembly factor FliW
MQKCSLKTSRFGVLEIDESRIIRFPEGLLGFPEQKRYVILEHKPGSPFYWLQSMDSPDLAFVIADSLLIKENYLEALPEKEKPFFRSDSGGDIAVFSLVTIPQGDVKRMTVNLIGPLVIDVGAKTGKQIILSESGYDCRHPLAKRP